MSMAYRGCDLLDTMSLQTSSMGGFWEISWDRHNCPWYLQTLNQHAPMVLLGRPMVCRACAMLSTRNQQTKPMGGLQKYHGTSLTAHGTCAHCLVCRECDMLSA